MLIIIINKIYFIQLFLLMQFIILNKNKYITTTYIFISKFIPPLPSRILTHITLLTDNNINTIDNKRIIINRRY